MTRADPAPEEAPHAWQPPGGVLLVATDLNLARRFYQGTLGLARLVADPRFLTLGCGGDRRLVVTKSTTGTAEQPPRRPGRWTTWPSSAPSRGWPTSASPRRPGSSTPTTTGSARSNSKTPTYGPPAPAGQRLARPGSRDGGELAHGQAVGAIVVVRNPPMLSMPSGSERLRRTQASCRASSASLIDPSIRYALARRQDRCCSTARSATAGRPRSRFLVSAGHQS
jgi:hypothetical protein